MGADRGVVRVKAEAGSGVEKARNDMAIGGVVCAELVVIDDQKWVLLQRGPRWFRYSI